ncbi:thioesterase [Aliifodinibius sp. S!AR15-10]|uniref:acyl-[acyl-carrier-protein] thioesterase n=1 Tax=Aliifodinibius sp. S!AR15-10 TaxID=2950437 RepID=UPI002862FE6C|nr:acyl-ACP thioesterase domain-containing protein [Aliifodinibius sp. S!AR15-10]MDR8391801.1 thioesterase [Aliifodinibius sp. S!AR15-10]
MVQEKQVFSEPFKIRSSEIRPDGKAKLQTICDLLQEIAGNHALQLNFDVTQLNEKNLTWVLHRLDVQIERYPEWRETVEVETWPAGGDKLRAHRDFQVWDEQGNIIIRALSYWLMIDRSNRRPVRIPDEVLNMASKDINHVIPVKKTRPSSPKSTESEKQFSVRYSDLDVNRHVNNIKYVEWVTETLPKYRLTKTMDIEFKAECNHGDTIKVATGPVKDNNTQSDVMIQGEGNVLATANLELFD